MKKDLLFCLYSVFFGVAGMLLPLFSVSAAAIVYEQNFDGLNLGILAGQDSWAGSVNFLVEGAENKNVKIDEHGNSISRGFNPTNNAVVSFSVKSENRTIQSGRGVALQIRNYFDLNNIAQIRFYWNSSTGGNVQVFSASSWYNVAAFSENVWYNIVIAIDSNSKKYKIQIDGGSWSAWYDFGNAGVKGDAAEIMLDSSGGEWLGMQNGKWDDFLVTGDIVIPAPVITSPSSGTTISAPEVQVSGTCDEIGTGYSTIFLKTFATSTPYMMGEGSATCTNGVWNTSNAPPPIFQGGQELRAYRANDNNLFDVSTSSNIVTIYGGAGTLSNDFSFATTTAYSPVSTTPEEGFQNKFFKPFTFLRDLKVEIDALTTATSSAFYLGASTTAMMTYIFSPMRTGLSVIIYLTAALYFVRRIANLDI